MLGGRGGRVGLAVRVGGEPISHAAYGVNQWNLVAAIDLLAQAAYSGVDHVGLWIELIAPHGSEQHGPGQHLLRMRHHVGEQAAFARLQRKHLAVAGHPRHGQVVAQVGVLEHAFGTAATRAPHQRLGASQKLDQGEGFGQVVVAARLESPYAFVQSRERAEHDYRRLDAHGAQFGQDRQAVDLIGQHAIQDDQIPRFARSPLQPLNTIVTNHGPVPQLAEPFRDVMGVLAVVLNDEAIPHQSAYSFRNRGQTTISNASPGDNSWPYRKFSIAIHRRDRGLTPRAEKPKNRNSVLAFGDFDQVIAELGLHRTLHHADGCAEYHFVEFANHFTAAEAAECAAVAAGGAAGVFSCNLGEVGTILDGLLQLIALGFVVDEDVTGGRSCHWEYS